MFKVSGIGKNCVGTVLIKSIKTPEILEDGDVVLRRLNEQSHEPLAVSLLNRIVQNEQIVIE